MKHHNTTGSATLTCHLRSKPSVGALATICLCSKCAAVLQQPSLGTRPTKISPSQCMHNSRPETSKCTHIYPNRPTASLCRALPPNLPSGDTVVPQLLRHYGSSCPAVLFPRFKLPCHLFLHPHTPCESCSPAVHQKDTWALAFNPDPAAAHAIAVEL